MPSSPPQLGPRDAMLWRVGRNLQRLQYIEAQLKSLLPTVRLSGTPDQIAAQVRKRERKLKNATLGTLTDEFAKKLLSPGAVATEQTSCAEPHLSFSMAVQAPPEVLKTMRADWRRVAKERNELVHSALLAEARSSESDCIAFSRRLDEQYERAGVLLARLAHHVKARQLAAAAFSQLHESGQLE